MDNDIIPHFSLGHRDVGTCKKLLGSTYLVCIYVSTPQHPWTKQQKDRVRHMNHASVRFLQNEAKRYGAQLNMQIGNLDYKIPYEYSSDYKWYRHILGKHFGETSMVPLHNKYARQLGVKNAPVAFMFNIKARSCATHDDSRFPNVWDDEFCMMFCDKENRELALAHELLHMYGAIDLYDYNKHEGVQSAAKKYFWNSVMMDGETALVDPLNAYLVGWTDVLTPKAKAFMRATQGLRKW